MLIRKTGGRKPLAQSSVLALGRQCLTGSTKAHSFTISARTTPIEDDKPGRWIAMELTRDEAIRIRDYLTKELGE